MDKIKKEKGFTYIITVTIIIVFISLLFILFKPIEKSDNSAENIAENYKIELNKLLDSNLDVSKIDLFNSSFIEYIQSHNFNVEICNIIDDGNNIYISNYLGKSCDLYFNSDLNQTLTDKETIKIDSFINNTNIYLCNCSLDYSTNNKVTSYINIYNNKTRTIK